jgi:hypothetical protein
MIFTSIDNSINATYQGTVGISSSNTTQHQRVSFDPHANNHTNLVGVQHGKLL